jgi:hypothetical protein
VDELWSFVGSKANRQVERFNCTLRQRVSRLVRSTLSCSKKLANHIGAITYFICDYNLTKSAALPGEHHPVTFVHQARTGTGTVAKKCRTSAQVVCDRQRGFRVPYALLTLCVGTPSHRVQHHTDPHRASFHPGDRVQLGVRGKW